MEGTIASEVTTTSSTLIYDQAAVTLFTNIQYWWQVFIPPFGITANILCILVMGQRHNRSFSSSVYVITLAVCDIIHLIAASCDVFLKGTGSLQEEIIVCKCVLFFLFSSNRSGVMIIVALLVERMIAVACPLKAVILLSPRRAMNIVLVVVIVTIIFNIPVIFATSRVDTIGGQCIVIVTDSIFYAVHGITGLFLYGLFPLVAILLLNVIIMYYLKSSGNAFEKFKKDDQECSTNVQTEQSEISSDITNNETLPKHKRAGENCTPVMNVSEEFHNQFKSQMCHYKDQLEQKRRIRDRQLTIMTVAMTLAFFIFNVSLFVYIAIFRNVETKNSPQMQTWFGWCITVIHISSTLNCTTNLFMYIITSSKFRSDLKKLFCCHLKRST